MLRFINIEHNTIFGHIIFQYIPCYGLSLHAFFRCLSISYFNTSHVTVYQILMRFIREAHKYFNTSHVTVYRKLPIQFNSALFYFNTSHVTVYQVTMEMCVNIRKISIHPMLRFIIRVLFHPYCITYISIHPMLRFIIVYFSYITALVLISIHPMLRFITINTLKGYTICEFQYIPCYGLSNDFKPFLSWHLSSFPLFYVISAFFTSRL